MLNQSADVVNRNRLCFAGFEKSQNHALAEGYKSIFEILPG
jgi:hypothetical protein